MKVVLNRSLVTPLLLHLAAWYMGEGFDVPGIVLLTSLGATFLSALMAAASLGPAAGGACSLWVPAAASCWDLHWAMGSVSPHGPAKSLLGLSGFDDPTGGRLSHVLLSAAAFAAAAALVQASPALRGMMRGFYLSDLGED